MLPFKVLWNRKKPSIKNNMDKIIFINYRREDTAPIARALAEAIRYRLGADKVFLDEDSIQHGVEWPDRLEKAVKKS